MLHNLDSIRAFCLALPHTTEDFPFGEDTLVFRVGGKIYALLGTDARPLSINLKCDPDRAQELRARHPAVLPGYHMNKKHWNTVILDGSLPTSLVAELITHSRELVAASLSRKEREALGL
ncbi:MAG: MmcQ/YjbR family DNA-binding protein [Bacteroidetes bacterium]|nr:MmcQ/YjbR family DNA-binding protein [Bacteroidota bacterium]